MSATLVDYVALSVNPAASNDVRHHAEIAAFFLAQPQGAEVVFAVPDVAGLGDDVYLFLAGYVPVTPLAWVMEPEAQAAFYLMIEGENLSAQHFEEDFHAERQLLLAERSYAGVVAALHAWVSDLGRDDLSFRADPSLEPAAALSAEMRAKFPDDFVAMR